jgi:hypothetical protein
MTAANTRISKCEVKTFKTDLGCSLEDCPGKYIFNGQVTSINGRGVFTHVCSACGDEQNFEKRFPEITYEEKLTSHD